MHFPLTIHDGSYCGNTEVGVIILTMDYIREMLFITQCSALEVYFWTNDIETVDSHGVVDLR